MDARAEISVAESRVDSCTIAARGAAGRPAAAPRGNKQCSLAPVGAVGSFAAAPLPEELGGLGAARRGRTPSRGRTGWPVRGRFWFRATIVILRLAPVRDTRFEWSV